MLVFIVALSLVQASGIVAQRTALRRPASHSEINSAQNFKRAFDGEEAVSRATRLLKSLGVRERLTLRTLSDHFYLSRDPAKDTVKNISWYVDFEIDIPGHKRDIAVAFDGRTGAVLMIQRNPEPSIQYAVNTPVSPQTVTRFTEMLHLIGYNDPVKFSLASGYKINAASVTFDCTLHGLIFFNLNPTYGHYLTIQPETRAILSFQAAPPLPDVNGWTPKVKESEALSKLSLWLADRLKAKKWPQELMKQAHQKVELGYWKFKAEPKARLVYRLSSYTVVGGQPHEIETYRSILLDAMTGELIKPDDPLIGANP